MVGLIGTSRVTLIIWWDLGCCFFINHNVIHLVRFKYSDHVELLRVKSLMWAASKHRSIRKTWFYYVSENVAIYENQDEIFKFLFINDCVYENIKCNIKTLSSSYNVRSYSGSFISPLNGSVFRGFESVSKIW